MKTLTRTQPQFEFCFPELDTLVLVEESNQGLIIRATQNTFTEVRKIFFIRELAAEGFISDSYQRFSDFRSTRWLPVYWVIDYSWLKLDPAQTARTRRIMTWILAGAGLLWLVMLAALFLGSSH